MVPKHGLMYCNPACSNISYSHDLRSVWASTYDFPISLCSLFVRTPNLGVAIAESGIFFVCGQKVIKNLPAHFQGCCFLGSLSPSFSIYNTTWLQQHLTPLNLGHLGNVHVHAVSEVRNHAQSLRNIKTHLTFFSQFAFSFLSSWLHSHSQGIILVLIAFVLLYVRFSCGISCCKFSLPAP